MKKIEFTYEGRDYTLEFTRKTIKELERSGFDIDNLGKTPMTTSLDLFEGAFRANHKYMRKDEIEKIFYKFKNRKELVGSLCEMYNEPLEELLEQEEDEGNATAWEKNF
jgi:hypothetical protein